MLTGVERSGNVIDGKPDMNAERKSDESVVPAKSANNDAAEASAESTEERGSAKRNAVQAALPRTQDRIERKSSGLHRVRVGLAAASTMHSMHSMH
jgi:hypothetical protein